MTIQIPDLWLVIVHICFWYLGVWYLDPHCMSSWYFCWPFTLIFWYCKNALKHSLDGLLIVTPLITLCPFWLWQKRRHVIWNDVKIHQRRQPMSTLSSAFSVAHKPGKKWYSRDPFSWKLARSPDRGPWHPHFSRLSDNNATRIDKSFEAKWRHC